MKICFRCKHYHHDGNETNALLRNICDVEESDPVYGAKSMQLCYLKNASCNCPDYERNEDVTKE